MEPRFQLRCLGEPVLLGPDGQPVRFKVRKHLALLVYLAVESGSRHRREHLAELLWPNLPDAEGRHSLATALSTLRARFGRDVVEAGRDDLRWSHTRLDVDLDRLAVGNVLGDEYTTPLDVAGFLDGFEVPGAAEFMLWRERQRARWLPLVRDALVVLMDRCRRTGDSRQIEQLADRMLRLDDLSEDAVRAKMEARAFAGDRLSALKIFEAWKERLHEELGASPSALLEGMALRLRRRGWERSGASEIPSVRTDQWKNRPFVGRANEYRTLYEGWERAQRGEPGHALVVGESGIGKSTLVERLTTAAGLEGASVARVQCYELEREIPYAAVCGLVRGLLDRPGASGTSSEALAELGRTVPEVRRRFPTVARAAVSDGETARLRLAEALQELVLSVAEEHPVILVVDDHHLADDASLAVLHLLMRRADALPVLVVLTARASEMGRSPQAARLKESLPRLGASTVELPALSEPESEELVASLIPPDGPQPNGAARLALIRAGNGYPMALELFCQDWTSHGERCLALSLGAMTPDPAQARVPAETYRQLHDRLVDSLDPVTRNVLNLASLLGHRLNDVSMYTLADLTIGQTMLGMSRLTSLRVLRDANDGLEFVNELVRAHAYLNVPSSVRRVLHGSIADRLIESERQGAELQGLEIAWHCIRSGRIAEGAPYLVKGAAQAIRRGAPQEAERGLASGLNLLQGALKDEGILLLTKAFQEQGAWAQSLQIIEESDEAFRGRHHDQVAALGTLAKLQLGMIDSQNAMSTLSELCRIAQHNHLVPLGPFALRVAATIVYNHRLDDAVSMLVRIAETCRPTSDPAAELDLRYTRAMLLAYSGDRQASTAELDAALDLIKAHSINNAMAGLTTIGMGAVKCAQGQYEDAACSFAAAYDLARRRGADDGMAVAAGNYALCMARLGRYVEQVEWARRGTTALGERFVDYRSVQIYSYLARGLVLLGKVEEARRALSTLDAIIPYPVSPWIEQTWQLQKADVLALASLDAAAKAEALKGVSGKHAALHARSVAGSFARWLATTANSFPAASEAYDRVAALRRDLELYDALDQVEILAARRLLETRYPRLRSDSDHVTEEALLRERVLRLPVPATRQLKLLGLPL